MQDFYYSLHLQDILDTTDLQIDFNLEEMDPTLIHQEDLRRQYNKDGSPVSLDKQLLAVDLGGF